jgi:hypothetical protein
MYSYLQVFIQELIALTSSLLQSLLSRLTTFGEYVRDCHYADSWLLHFFQPLSKAYILASVSSLVLFPLVCLFSQSRCLT